MQKTDICSENIRLFRYD